MTGPTRVRCPAKVNRFLSVGPCDADGFHPVRTLYEAVGLWDELEILPSSATEVICSWNIPSENTLTKTLRFVRELIEVPPLKISLNKGIPPGSGMGGASSDAAGLLRALRRAYPHVLSDALMQEIAGAVGKDVPFFLVGGRARGEGYGEVLTPLEDREPQWLVIAWPEVTVSTPTAYQLLDASGPLELMEWEELEARPTNTFERVAPAQSLSLKRRLLELGANEALLTGSGSAVFGTFDDEEGARRARRELVDCRSSWVTRTLTRRESLWTS